MQSLGRWGVAITLRDIRIRHEQLHQSLQVRILKASHEFGQRSPELANVLCGLREIVGEVDLGFRHAAQLVNRKLKPVLILIDQAFDLEEVVLLEAENEFIDVVPHLGFNLPGAIRQNQRQIRLAIFLCLDLLRRHHEAGGDDLVLLMNAFRYKELFHEPPRNLPAKTGETRTFNPASE